MYSKTVTIEGRKYEVLYCPDTPDYVVLARAAAMAKAQKERTVEAFWKAERGEVPKRRFGLVSSQFGMKAADLEKLLIADDETNNGNC